MNAIISELCKERLVALLAERGYKNTATDVTEKEVLENLKLLTEEGKSESIGGDVKSKFLPLHIKKLVFGMLFPDGMYEVSLPKMLSNGFWVCTAKVFKDDTSTRPIGEHSMYFPPCHKASEDEDENLVLANYVASIKGRTLTRAFANAGIGFLEFEFTSEETLSDSLLHNIATNPVKDVSHEAGFIDFNNIPEP